MNERNGSFKSPYSKVDIKYIIKEDENGCDILYISFDDYVTSGEFDVIRDAGNKIFEMFLKSKFQNEEICLGDLFVSKLPYANTLDKDSDIFQIIMENGEENTFILRHILIKKSYEKIAKEAAELFNNKYVPEYMKDVTLSKVQLLQNFKKIDPVLQQILLFL